MTELTTSDEIFEVIDEVEGVSIVVSSDKSIPVTAASGDMVTVEAAEPAVILFKADSPSSGDGGGTVEKLDDIQNVTEDARAAGSVLAFDALTGTWRPTNSQTNQLYDGGNF